MNETFFVALENFVNRVVDTINEEKTSGIIELLENEMKPISSSLSKIIDELKEYSKKYHEDVISGLKKKFFKEIEKSTKNIIKNLAKISVNFSKWSVRIWVEAEKKYKLEQMESQLAKLAQLSAASGKESSAYTSLSAKIDGVKQLKNYIKNNPELIFIGDEAEISKAESFLNDGFVKGFVNSKEYKENQTLLASVRKEYDTMINMINSCNVESDNFDNLFKDDIFTLKPFYCIDDDKYKWFNEETDKDCITDSEWGVNDDYIPNENMDSITIFIEYDKVDEVDYEVKVTDKGKIDIDNYKINGKTYSEETIKSIKDLKSLKASGLTFIELLKIYLYMYVTIYKEKKRINENVRIANTYLFDINNSDSIYYKLAEIKRVFNKKREFALLPWEEYLQSEWDKIFDKFKKTAGVPDEPEFKNFMLQVVKDITSQDIIEKILDKKIEYINDNVAGFDGLDIIINNSYKRYVAKINNYTKEFKSKGGHYPIGNGELSAKLTLIKILTMNEVNECANISSIFYGDKLFDKKQTEKYGLIKKFSPDLNEISDAMEYYDNFSKKVKNYISKVLGGE